MQSYKYKRVLAAVTERPWAMLPSKLSQIAELLVLKSNGDSLTEQEIADAISGESWAGKSSKATRSGNGVAVVPIYGVIQPRADMFSEVSGGTGMNQFVAALKEAVADPQVGSILLDVDSPGGQVDGVPEAAAAIRAARKQKPVVAIANTMAASAAYWLASQADEFYASPSAEVGSIGVYAAHNDISQAQQNLGVKTTLISAGKFKTELSPFEPLSEDARAGVQEKVDEYYGMFVSDVAQGRKKPIAQVRSGFGQGRMLIAGSAAKENMVDGVATFDSVVGRMLNGVRSNTGSQALEIETDFQSVLPELYDSEKSEEKDPENSSSQDALAELRKKSRETAQTERENYLALLRRTST